VIEKGKAEIDPEYMARFKSSRVGVMMGKPDGTGVARKQMGPMPPTAAGTTNVGSGVGSGSGIGIHGPGGIGGPSGTTTGRNGLHPTRSELEG